MPRPAPQTTILDLRSAAAYAAERPRGAVHLSLDDLEHRAYLLPPRSRSLVVIATDGDEAEAAARVLARAERSVRTFTEATWRQQLESESGPPTRRAAWEPSSVVVRALDHLPAGNRDGTADTPLLALDVACGSGRHAVFLAQQGLQVVGVDWLPDALSRAQELAARSDVHIETVQRDLTAPDALATWQADCIVVTRYLDRALFGPLLAALRPGGILVYETFTIEQRSQGHPRNPDYMLQPGELQQAFASLQELFYDEDWHDGAHTAQFIGRRHASNA